MTNETNLKLKNDIDLLLNFYATFIKSQSHKGKNDFATECENIFCPILNEIYNFNLVNVNRGKANVPVIDLVDDINKVCVQVTSTSNVTDKIIYTTEKYRMKDSVDSNLKERYENLKKYDKLKILFLTYSSVGKSKKVKLEPNEEIINFTTLSDKIENLDKQKLEKIRNILKAEIGIMQLFDELETNFYKQNTNFPNEFTSYLDYCGITVDSTSYGNSYEDEQQYAYEMFKSFADKLEVLPPLTRCFISYAIKNGLDGYRTNSHKKIYFHLRTLELHFKNHEDDFNKIITSLTENDIYDFQEMDMYDEMTEIPVHHFEFYDGESGCDVLYVIYEYCLEKKIDIDLIIKDLDFRVLNVVDASVL